MEQQYLLAHGLLVLAQKKENTHELELLQLINLVEQAQVQVVQQVIVWLIQVLREIKEEV